jgi:hypothetical protein
VPQRHLHSPPTGPIKQTNCSFGHQMSKWSCSLGHIMYRILRLGPLRAALASSAECKRPSAVTFGLLIIPCWMAEMQPCRAAFALSDWYLT